MLHRMYLYYMWLYIYIESSGDVIKVAHQVALGSLCIKGDFAALLNRALATEL